MQNNRGTFDRSPIACHFLGLGNFFTATNSPQGAQWFLLLCFSSLSCSLLFFSMFFGVAWHSHTLFVGQLFLWKKLLFISKFLKIKYSITKKLWWWKRWFELKLTYWCYGFHVVLTVLTYSIFDEQFLPSFSFTSSFIEQKVANKVFLPLVEKARKRCS